MDTERNRPLRVLYMEDDPGLARLVQKRLRRSGCDVTVAEDGQTGLSMFEEAEYDLLLLDQEMPVYSGLKVIERMASEERLPPTIMLTGAGNEQTAVTAMKHGVGDYIVKDPSGAYLDLLPAVIERVMARHRLLQDKLRAEEALRESEARFRTVAETAADAIVCADSRGRIILWNRAAHCMFGYDEQEAIGMSLSSLMDEVEREDDNESLLGADVSGSGSHFEALGCRKDGSSFPVEVSMTTWDVRTETLTTAILRDISERKEYEEKLEHMAHHDSLTGVFNRHYLATALKRETARAERYKHPIGFLMIDVNRFKMINDTMGHKMGDFVIQSVAEVVQRAIRRVDMVFRYGGDEFLVVLPETNGDSRFVKEHVVRAMDAWNQESDTLDFDVTLSIGVSHWLPGGAQTTDEALNLADARMYEEKHGTGSVPRGA